MLYAINRTVGFFGDATMEQAEVDKLVAEVRRLRGAARALRWPAALPLGLGAARAGERAPSLDSCPSPLEALTPPLPPHPALALPPRRYSPSRTRTTTAGCRMRVRAQRVRVLGVAPPSLAFLFRGPAPQST